MAPVSGPPLVLSGGAVGVFVAFRFPGRCLAAVPVVVACLAWPVGPWALGCCRFGLQGPGFLPRLRLVAGAGTGMPAYPSRLSKTRAGFGRLPSVSGSPRRGVLELLELLEFPRLVHG